MNHIIFTFTLIGALSITIFLRELHILLKGKNEILREYIKYAIIVTSIIAIMMLLAYPLLTIKYVETL